MSGERIGEVTHFYNKICVAVVELDGKLSAGDSVHFLGSSTDFQQDVASMQIEHEEVDEAGPGEVALKVEQRVRRGDRLFKLEDEE